METLARGPPEMPELVTVGDVEILTCFHIFGCSVDSISLGVHIFLNVWMFTCFQMFGCLDDSICLDVCMLRCLDDKMLKRWRREEWSWTR